MDGYGPGSLGDSTCLCFQKFFRDFERLCGAASCDEGRARRRRYVVLDEQGKGRGPNGQGVAVDHPGVATAALAPAGRHPPPVCHPPLLLSDLCGPEEAEGTEEEEISAAERRHVHGRAEGTGIAAFFPIQLELGHVCCPRPGTRTAVSHQ